MQREGDGEGSGYPAADPHHTLHQYRVIIRHHTPHINIIHIGPGLPHQTEAALLCWWHGGDILSGLTVMLECNVLRCSVVWGVCWLLLGGRLWRPRAHVPWGERRTERTRASPLLLTRRVSQIQEQQHLGITTTTTTTTVVRRGGYIGRQCPSRSEWGETWLVRRVVNSPTFWPESSQETLRPHQSQTTACSYQRTVIWASRIQITRHLVINSPGLTDPLHNLGSQTFFSWKKQFSTLQCLDVWESKTQKCFLLMWFVTSPSQERTNWRYWSLLC